MKILIITRGHELRHILRIEDTLSKNHEIWIINTEKARYPFWYKIAYKAREYQFYFKKIPHQAEWYKKRIFKGNPFLKYYGKIKFLSNLKINVPQRIKDELKRINPDMVLSSTLMLLPTYEDHLYAFATKELKIPLIGFVPTWDSLTNKSVLYPKPDIMFCWNETMKKELMEYHDMRENDIYPVGPYTFEEWIGKQPIPREKFCAKHGLNPKQKFITYICSSPALIGDENEAIEQVRKQYPQYQLVVRSHPDKAYSTNDDRIKYLFPISTTPERDVQTAYDTYYHSQAVFGINSSAMLQAMYAGRPVFPVWINPEIQENTLHFKQIIPLLEEKHQSIREFLGITNTLPSYLVKSILESIIPTSMSVYQ